MPVRAANEQVGAHLLSDVLAGLRHALGQVSASERQESAFQFPPTPRNRLTLYPSSGYTLSMTKTQMVQAVRGYDEMMILVAEMTKATAAGEDAMLNLIERITEAARAATVEDIKIDLADFGQTEAVETIKANY